METKKVAIVGYNRIPFARMNTAYSEQGNQDLLLAALNGLIDRYQLKGNYLEKLPEAQSSNIFPKATSSEKP
jgi:acetyl-CoA C-acetyltransferase